MLGYNSNIIVFFQTSKHTDTFPFLLHRKIQNIIVEHPAVIAQQRNVSHFSLAPEIPHIYWSYCQYLMPRTLIFSILSTLSIVSMMFFPETIVIPNEKNICYWEWICESAVKHQEINIQGKPKKNFSEICYCPGILLGYSNGEVDIQQKTPEDIFPHLHKMGNQSL